VVTGEAELWPKGIVPFKIDPLLSKSVRSRTRIVQENLNLVVTENEQKYILNAMNNFHQNSCVRFVRHTDEEDYIYITDAKRG